MGCERLATGHYVRRIDGPDGPELHRAADLARDQSWFLFATTRDAACCSRCFRWARWPTSGRCAREAERLGLPVAAKPDSQDICFVPSGHYADTVVRLRPDAGEPGEIVDRDGRVLARHDGIARYTVGQGKRLGAAAVDGGQRQTVVALDPRAAAGRRGTARRRHADGAPARGELAGRAARRPMACCRSSCAPARRRRPRPLSHRPMRRRRCGWTRPALPAPGQACVFYSGSRILGGGIIKREQIDDVAKPGLSAGPSA